MADETPPLDEAGIRERLARYEHTMDTATFYPGYVVTGNYVADVPALLAEVDRLRAREAAMQEGVSLLLRVISGNETEEDKLILKRGLDTLDKK